MYSISDGTKPRMDFEYWPIKFQSFASRKKKKEHSNNIRVTNWQYWYRSSNTSLQILRSFEIKFSWLSLSDNSIFYRTITTKSNRFRLTLLEWKGKHLSPYQINFRISIRIEFMQNSIPSLPYDSCRSTDGVSNEIQIYSKEMFLQRGTAPLFYDFIRGARRLIRISLPARME